MPGRWQGSSRRTTLPPNWNSEIRPAILNRDGHRCTWLDGHDDGGFNAYLTGDYDPADRCTELGTDVDHVGDQSDHSPGNLRTLGSWHHNRRSSQQGNANRRRYSNRRPAEPHPGLR